MNARRERRPTFCVEDDDRRLLTFGPESYLDYEYSPDGNWLTLTLPDGTGDPHRRTFFIGYPA